MHLEKYHYYTEYLFMFSNLFWSYVVLDIAFPGKLTFIWSLSLIIFKKKQKQTNMFSIFKQNLHNELN